MVLKKKVSAKGGKRAAKKITKKTVKKAKKKLLKKRPAARKKSPVKIAAKKEGNLIGIVTHYFPHVQAAVIKLKGPLAMGDTIKIKGHTTDFSQAVTSMQIDRVVISSAKKGDEIGLQVTSRVRQGDKTYKL
ncbi:MAG: hypothetical protein PHP73_03265 [Candidatus Omnitrophica bacterium]|nr:hypothetical protein [Candidatus Omnitrophota bacterium]